MKNLNIINKKGIKLNTANKYVDDDINVGLTQTDKNNLVAENIKSGVEILGVVGSYEGGGGGASLNVAYGTTPPADTTKIWLQCEEPQAVEVQNYLGECAVSEVANYGGIDNPTSDSAFYDGYFNSCYIGNNQIAIVGFNHIRIYDLTTKAYIADYTISVGTSAYYSNVLLKNNVLYFGYTKHLYSYNLETQTLETIYTTTSSSYSISYIHFYTDNEINLFIYSSNSDKYGIVYKFEIANKTATEICKNTSGLYSNYRLNKSGNVAIRTNDYVYNFYYISSYAYFGGWKYDLKANSYSTLTSWNDFVANTLGLSSFDSFSTIYDNERYIYIIGGGYNSSGQTFDRIIKYDTVNDTFELLDKKLFGKGKMGHFSILVNNRVYIFGGKTWTTNGVTNGRKNVIDYFDISYPLTQNDVILTINNKTANNLPLINTDKLKLNSNIASAYKGNADNLAEKVNVYYWDGSKWVGINCEDYYFEWSTIPNQTVSSDSSVTIDLSSYCTNNTESEAVFTARESGDVSYFSLVVSGTQLTISPAVSSAKTSTIYVTATVNEKAYTTSFNVTVGDLS